MKFQKGNPGGPGRPKGVTIGDEIKKFLGEVLTSAEYRENFRQRATTGDLPPQLEVFCLTHFIGNAKHHVEHTGKDGAPIGVSVVPVGQLTDQQLDVIEQVLMAGSTLRDVVPVPEPDKVQ